jgi:hypothetical protein
MGFVKFDSAGLPSVGYVRSLDGKIVLRTSVIYHMDFERYKEHREVAKEVPVELSEGKYRRNYAKVSTAMSSVPVCATLI